MDLFTLFTIAQSSSFSFCIISASDSSLHYKGTPHTTHHTPHTTQSTLRNHIFTHHTLAHRTMQMQTSNCKLQTAHCTLHTVKCKLCGAHYTVFPHAVTVCDAWRGGRILTAGRRKEGGVCTITLTLCQGIWVELEFGQNWISSKTNIASQQNKTFFKT